jgi:hypothetical protein
MKKRQDHEGQDHGRIADLRFQISKLKICGAAETFSDNITPLQNDFVL